MSYVTEFTGDIRYIKGYENLTADALSRVTINNVEYFRDGIDFESVAAAQTNDADLLEHMSSLLLWCDTSTGVVRAFLS